MAKETIVSQLSNEERKRIKKIVEFHHGFKPKDKDIDWIDEMLRNKAVGGF